MAEPSEVIDEQRQAAGQAILELTDRFGFDAFAAGWLYDRPSGHWRYLLVTPMLRTRGPAWVYERLLRLFSHNPLPAGLSPLDVYVIDPDMEAAAFGPPWLAYDGRKAPQGLILLLAHDVRIQDFLIEDGFVAFYRRLPTDLRERKGDPSPRFSARIRQLDKAA